MLIEALRPMTTARLMVIAVNATLRTAASALSNPHIRILVVCDENRKAAGVVSKSDLVRHLSNVGVTRSPRCGSHEPECQLLSPQGRSL